MKNVNRLTKPKSLKENATTWKRELLAELSRAKKTSDVSEKFYNRYKKKDVRATLIEMYNGCCCYCETHIGDASFEQIEHRKPKKKSLKKYPDLTFEWDNLHLCCERCNGAKGNKFDESAPILDAVKDQPISDHLTYCWAPTGLYCEAKTDRGQTTIDHADLDRLKKKRLEFYSKVNEVIKKLHNKRGTPKAQTHFRILKDMCAGEHGSVVRWALEEWGYWEES